ncbi:MAG: hypothetical protein HGA23_10930, partial [Bacteroidales bacterium]|nr:hypothetical protein [Bacteroidales bacterium]
HRFLSCEPLLGPVDLISATPADQNAWETLSIMDGDPDPTGEIDEGVIGYGMVIHDQRTVLDSLAHERWLRDRECRARQIRLQLLVESEEAMDFLVKNIKAPLKLWIKVDVGYHRSGLSWDDDNNLLKMARQIRKTQHALEGLLTHAGHSYHVRGKTRLLEIYHESVQKLNHARDMLLSNGIAPLKISYGDTPTCSVVDQFHDIDEIRPGNFVFYDVMQLQIGSCTEAEIACAMVCPVVAKYPERQELLIHGGAVHLSKEFILDENGQKIFGYLAGWDGKVWGPIIPDCRVSALSQEHGIIKANPALLTDIKVGDLLAILPVHSCLAMDLMGDFVLV